MYFYRSAVNKSCSIVIKNNFVVPAIHVFSEHSSTLWLTETIKRVLCVYAISDNGFDTLYFALLFSNFPDPSLP